MTRALFIPIFAIAACGDPSISVVFQIDEPYRASVTGSTLRIYQPLPAAPFTCDELAFGLIDEDVLRLSLVSEISLVSASEAPLEVDRVAPKLFWADGLDSSKRRLVTGCAEQGEIDGDTEVLIRAEPTKLVSVVSQPSLSIPMGASLSDPIVFAVTDLDRRPLSGVEVRWEIDGAGGSGPNGATTTRDDGNAEILPTLPTRPGPFVLDVEIRWADEDPAPVTGFVSPAARSLTVNNPVFDYRGGPIGPNGEPGFAALIGGQLGAYKVLHVYQNPQGELQMRFSQDIAISAPQLGLIDPMNAGERARAIVVGIDQWVEVGIDGNLMTRTYDSPIGLAPVSVEMSGSCEPGSPPQVFVSYESNFVGIFTAEAQGSVFITDADLDLIASGCVTDEVRGDRRILILLEPQLTTLYVAALEGDQFIGQPWFAVPFGIAFAPAVGTTDKLLLGTQLSRNDVVISRNVVRSEQDTLRLVERDADFTNAIPIYTDAGDIDADGTLDVVSLLDQQQTIDDPESYALFSALGRTRDGKRIVGAFDVTGNPPFRAPEMILIDIDRDGSDDVIVAERATAPPIRIAIYEMGQLNPE